LTANGVVGTNAVVTWWSGSGGTGTNYGTGTTISKGPGTYYARVTGDCGSAVEAAVIVAGNVQSTEPTSISGTSAICSGSTTMLTATGGMAGTNCTYEWGTGTTVGLNIISGANSVSYTSPALSSNTTFWVRRIDPTPCNTITGGATLVVNVTPLPTPSFTTYPSSSTCANTDVVYTTQAGMSDYTWIIPGILNSDYKIISGGISNTDNTVTLRWLSGGSKAVKVNYSSDGCAGSIEASQTTSVIVPATSGLNSGDMVWTGNTNNDLSNASNWLVFDNGASFSTTSSVSFATTNFIIRKDGSCFTTVPELSSTMECNNFTIDSGNMFSMSDKVIVAHGNFSNYGTISTKHSLGIDGNLNVSGVIKLDSTSNYIFNGNVPQFTGALPQKLNNLTVDNTAGNVILSTSGHTIVKGELNVLNGYLTINSDAQITVKGNTTLSGTQGLVLKSDVSGTASFIDNGTIAGTGKVVVEKYLATGTTSGWYVTPPISDAQSTIFDAPASGVWFYNSSLPAWQQVPAGSLNIMTGYVVKYSENKVLNFNGTLNYGEKSRIDLVRTYSPNNFGWNLVGNPYPSALDWDLTDAVHVNAAMYFRKADGDVAYYVKGGLGNPETTTGIIPSMQAFWAQVNIAYPAGSLTFNNSARTHSSIPFYKSKANIPLLRLKADNGHNIDETLIYFNTDATDGFDGAYDALKLNSEDVSQPAVFSYTNNHESLAINALAFNNGPLSVPLGYKSLSTGPQKITLFDFNNIDSNINIILEDLLLNIFHDLRQNPTYNFNYFADNTDRFVLHFNYNSSGNEYIARSEENINIYNINDDIYINFLSESISEFTITICNLIGQIIYNETLNNPQGLHKIHFNEYNGQYIVRIKSDKFVLSKKITLFR